MKRPAAGDKRIWAYLLLILAMAFALRAWKLTRQSLWIDELITMNEASPELSWSGFVAMLQKHDVHPPFYYIILRTLFLLFGHTEFVARFFSACCGTLSVWLMYLLGKEMRDRELGILTALLTAVNYYNLYYSQEARNYILAFCLCALSFVFLIRLFKKRSWPLTIAYGVSTACMVSTHYFCLFVFAAQLVLMAAFFFTAYRERRPYLLPFIVACSLAVLAFLAYLPVFLAAAQRKSFWIQKISPAFPADLFSTYFGSSFLLQPLLIMLLIFFVLRAFNDSETHEGLPLPFAFCILFCWVAVSLYIPYVRSRLAFPIIISRYAIVVLPAFITAVAYGLRLVRPPGVKALLASALVVFSLFHVVLFNRFYTAIYKTQLREVTEFVARNNPQNYPIISEFAAVQQRYYFARMGAEEKLLPGAKAAVIGAILEKSEFRQDIPAFWIIRAQLQMDMPLAETWQKKLDFFFAMTKEGKFFDACAQLYQVRPERKNARLLAAGDLLPGANWQADAAGAITLRSGRLQTRPLSLAAGEYELAIGARGDAGRGEFARIGLEVDGKAAGEFNVSERLDFHMFPFRVVPGQAVVIAIEKKTDPRSGKRAWPDATIDLLALCPGKQQRVE